MEVLLTRLCQTNSDLSALQCSTASAEWSVPKLSDSEWRRGDSLSSTQSCYLRIVFFLKFEF